MTGWDFLYEGEKIALGTIKERRNLMWFAFPEGVDQISVEQQIFRPEHKDKDGRQFFRAPDHFAPTILGQPGFARVEQPEGAPEDLPKDDPQRSAALDQMATEVGALQEEVVRLRAENADLIKERDALLASNKGLEEELDAQDKELTKLRESIPTHDPVSETKSKK